MPLLSELVKAVDGWYPPALAEPWDAVGLVCGDPGEPVRRVLLAVDPVRATVAQACAEPSTLLITHHPLLLTGVHGVPADDPKGALVHQLIRAGAAHLVAHTNADRATPGVSDALAERLGLHDLRPIEPAVQRLDKLVVFVPTADAERMIDALAAAGAGRIGAYDRCAWTSPGSGTFRPLHGADPAVGTVGEIENLTESRVEMVVPRTLRAAVLAAMRAAHPYEEPAFDVVPMADLPTAAGVGRVGELAEPMPFADVVALAARRLPATVWGVRGAGAAERAVHTVAVCGGSGGSLIPDAVAAGAQAFLTADLKHHPVSEAVAEPAEPRIALIDAAHWATEAPWLDQVAAALRERFGTTVEVTVSRLVTDPWDLHHPSNESSTE